MDIDLGIDLAQSDVEELSNYGMLMNEFVITPTDN